MDENTVEEFHFIPSGDTIVHKECQTCDCQPYWDPENKKSMEAGKAKKMVWIHRRIKDNLH